MAIQESEIISKSAGLAMLKAGREKDGTASAAQAQPATNPVSEAARTLGQRGAEARAQARQAPAAPADKPAKAPAQARPEQPEEEAADNPDEEPGGHGAEEEQPDTADEQSEDSTGAEPTIEIGGEKLTKREIEDSILRQADFTRKTQDVAERRQYFEHSIGVVTQSSQRLDQLVAVLESAIGQEPDWVTLAGQASPQQFQVAQATWAQQQKVLQTVRQQKAQHFDQALNQAKAVMIEEAARTFKPEWMDRGKREEGIRTLADYAVQRGILPDELKMLHRTPMLQILDESFQYRKLMAAKDVTDKRVQGKPKPLRPGAQRSHASAAETQIQSARQGWESKRNPSVADALRFLKEKQEYAAKTGRVG